MQCPETTAADPVLLIHAVQAVRRVEQVAAKEALKKAEGLAILFAELLPEAARQHRVSVLQLLL
jgi:hypothetical protein